MDIAVIHSATPAQATPEQSVYLAQLLIFTLYKAPVATPTVSIATAY